MLNLGTLSSYHAQGIVMAREYLSYVEQGFDYCGYAPILSTVTGGLRIQFGTLEIIAAIAMATLTALIFVFSQREEFKKGTLATLDFAVHGAVNMGRGFIECHRYINLICPLHDYVVRGQDLRITYNKPIFK